MAGATNVGESGFLNAVLRGSTASPLDNLGTCWIALYHTADPGEGSTVTNEVSAAEYTAMSLVLSDTAGGTAADTAGDTLTNHVLITFTSNASITSGAAGANGWTTGGVVAYGIHIAVNASGISGDNMIISGVWDTAAVVNAGDTVQIAAGDLVITCG